MLDASVSSSFPLLTFCSAGTLKSLDLPQQESLQHRRCRCQGFPCSTCRFYFFPLLFLQKSPVSVLTTNYLSSTHRSSFHAEILFFPSSLLFIFLIVVIFHSSSFSVTQMFHIHRFWVSWHVGKQLNTYCIELCGLHSNVTSVSLSEQQVNTRLMD